MQGRGIGRTLTPSPSRPSPSGAADCTSWRPPAGKPTRPTRRFYEALGYREAGRIPDFYGPGDDRVIFLKAAKDAKA